MGLILAGILVAAGFVGLVFLYCKLSKDFDTTIPVCLTILAIVLFNAGIFSGMFVPVSGYSESQIVSTTELVSLRDDTISKGSGSLFYVSVSGVNSYTYRFEIESQYATGTAKAYDSNTLIDGTDGNVITVEDDSYTDAKLVTYVKYGKKSFWTFASGAKQYEYVFYVPTGTIAGNVSLD